MCRFFEYTAFLIHTHTPAFPAGVAPSALTSSNTATKENRAFYYDARGRVVQQARTNAQGGTATETLSYTYSGPKRTNTGWQYDNHGNLTADPQAGLSVAWNAIDLPRTLTSSTAGTSRAYLADGTLAQIYDGSTTRLYLGDLVFTRTGTSGTPALESAGWEGGRLLNGSGTGNVLYYVTDHLGSTRVVKDGSGTIRQRFDYYPYGTVSRVYTSSSTTDSSEKRYRFGGKEIAGSALTELGDTGAAPAAPYLDFGARLYSPRAATWLSVDPRAEKYYGYSPYAYCAASPMNLVDPTGKSWYFSLSNGAFVDYIFDDDDFIYLLTDDQINEANGDPLLLQGYRDLDRFSNSYGQMALDGTLSAAVAENVLKDLFNRANHSTEDLRGNRFITNISVAVDMQNRYPVAESTSSRITLYPLSGHYWNGYDIISTMAHEIGHILDWRSGLLNNSLYNKKPGYFEKIADAFAKEHWSYGYISNNKTREYEEHARIYGF